jgi:hypothetical protein
MQLVNSPARIANDIFRYRAAWNLNNQAWALGSSCSLTFLVGELL